MSEYDWQLNNLDIAAHLPNMEDALAERVNFYAVSVFSRLSLPIENIERLKEADRFGEVVRFILHGYETGITPQRLAAEVRRLYW